MGVFAIRRRDYRGHGAWMTRAYALALGAGTQVFTGLVGYLVFRSDDAAIWAVLMGAGWVINLAVAEFVIRRRALRDRREARLGPAERRHQVAGERAGARALRADRSTVTLAGRRVSISSD